jgi:hypothetical protein
VLKLQLKCPTHPRYDPSTQGEAAIRGACVRCRGLLELYRAYLNIRTARFGLEEETE